jgi:hypothetical protein
MLCASPGSEPRRNCVRLFVPIAYSSKVAALHGQYTRTAADIEDDLVLEKVLVLDNGVHVRPRADLVFLMMHDEVSDCHG